MTLLSDDDVFGAPSAPLMSDGDVFGDSGAAEKSNPLRRYLADPAISLLKGAIGVPEAAVGIADMATAGHAGKFLEDTIGFKPKEAKNILNELYSPEQRAANEKVQNADGFTNTLGEIASNPSVVPHAVLESLPVMGAGGVVARGAGMVASKGVPLIESAALRGAIGEGVAGAGQAAEQTRQETKDGLLTPEQVALSAASGAGTFAFGAVGGKVANKLGIGDVDTMIAGGAPNMAKGIGKKGMLRSAAEGAISEGVLEELPQSVWEQAMQNIALDKPWYDGVENAAAMGLVTGGAMGAGGGLLGAHAERGDKSAPPANKNPLNEVAGLLPAPVYPGMESADVLRANVDRQNTIDSAQANADKIYAERDAYEAAMKTAFPYGMPAVTTPVKPIQAQIDEALGIDQTRLTGMQKIKYQNELKALIDTPVGITHDANGLEIPLTMGALLASQATVEETLRANKSKTTGAPSTMAPVPEVGPLSTAANVAIKTGMADALQPVEAAPAPAAPVYPAGSEEKGGTFGDGGTGKVVVKNSPDGSFTVTAVWDKGTAKKSTGSSFPAGTDVNKAVDQVTRNHGGFSASSESEQAKTGTEPAKSETPTNPAPADKEDIGAIFDNVMAEEKAHSPSANSEQNTPPPAARLPEPESAPVPVPAHAVTIAATEHNAEVYKPLIERLIRNKRNAKELGFDIDGAIGKAKEAMNGTKQMPGSFRSLAAKAEKRGDKETADVLRQVADLNDARKNPPKKAADVAPAPAAQLTAQGEDNGQEASRQTAKEVLTPAAVPAEQTGDGKLAAQKASIGDGFKKNREAVKELKVGDDVSYVQPGTFTQKDGSKLVDPVRNGKITKFTDKDQGTVEVNGNIYVGARFLKKTDGQKERIDEAAHEAATSPKNDTPLPTEAQQAAMNYKMGHVTLHGLDITIENPQGSVRSGVDADGKPWENTLANHYGYIKRTEGNDGDHVDVFIGDNPESEQVFIVDQKHTKTSDFDEHKVLLGFNSLTEAKAGYANSYQKGWMLKGVIGVTPATLDELKAWIASGDMSKPFAPQEAPQKTLPERVAEAKADSAEREKDEKGNPIYRKGERVEFTTGRNAGRHGAISEAVPMVATSFMMFSNETPTKTTTYYYQVQTDNGIEVSANPEEIAFETSRPESVVLDPVIDGRAIDPLVLHNSIGYARQSAENYRASAQRARKASAIAEHKRNAEVQDEKATKAQEAWSEWASKNPAEAEQIAPSKLLPASPAARKEAETGTTAAEPSEALKGAGLIVTKGLTNNGKPVWNVSGNTKEHSAIIKAAGGRWYGPKKVWSFYNADPSAALAAKFSGQSSATAATAPALDSNEVQLPGSHYVYAKDDQGWTWRVGNGPAYNGRGNALKSNAPIIEQLESLLAEKSPTINRTPTIEMSDAVLEKVLVNAETTPVEKDRAAAELDARDTADLPDIGAMFDEVLAEETAPEKPDPWKTVLVKANAFMTIDGVDYRVRNDFSQGNKDAGEPVSLRTSGMVAQVVEKPYAEVEAAIKANKEKVRKLPTPQVDAPTPIPKPRTAGQAAGSAVVNAAKGTGDVFDALGALFGSKGSRLSMGLSFDEDTYRQAKPLFISAIAHFKDAAADLKEAIRAVIKEMNSRFSPEVTENMKPYVVRFFEDVRAGDIVYDEKNGEYKDGTQTTGATDHGTLPGIPAESVSTNESGGDSGNVRPEQSRSGAGSDGGTSEPGLSANGSVGSGAGGSVPRRRKPKQGTPGDGGNLSAASPGQSHPVKSGLTDYVITDETRLGEGGAKTKFKNNLAAIRLITELDTSGRPVTRDDQDVLARYVGWGMLPQAFDATNKEWAGEFSELKGLLNEDEWNEAYMSTQYAHYTSEQIISNGIYAALERFGFSGGKILEPGSGVGNFVGLMPTSLRTAGSRVTGIERERISSKIGQYLYPTHNMLQADFTEFQSADGYFDAVAGNPPFAATALTDASGRKHLSGLSVHNYFFAKSVDLLRPGGVFAMVVSNSFLDGQKDNARRYIGERTRFLGAIRLPNNAFKKNAGTEVTTDLIFLQKLDDSDVASKATKEAAKAWMETSLIADPLGGEKIPLNDYFVAHPEMMLGRMERSGSMYRAASSALVAKEGADITTQLREAVAMLPAKVYVAPALAATSKAVNNAIVALEDATVQPGGMYTKDGALYVRLQNEAGEKLAQKLTPASQWTEKTVLGENRHERLMATADLRRTVRQLLAAEIKDDTTAMKQLRAQLNTQYDAIVKKWDFLSSKSTIQLLGDDPDYPLLAALETDYNKGIDAANAKKHGITAVKPSAKKMPIFTQRVIPMHEEVTHAETPVDALMVSIYERGHIDQQYISELLDGRDGKEIIDELVTQGHLFLDPEASHHVLKDEYLSGNVRRKIKIAQAAGLNENVRALEKVVPEDVPSHNIIGKMGASWISNEVYQDFINDMLGEGTESRVKYQPTAGSFIVEIKAGSEVANTNTLGIPVEGGRATDLIEKILNKKQAKIGSYDREGKFHLDKESTDKASDKIIEIKTRFGDWLFKDAARSEVLTRAYNDTVNNYVVRRFDGAMLTFPGKVPDSIIKFRRHQRNAIARILQSGQALLDHVVGAGKTFTIVAAAMEMRRTGIAHKPMVTVPNHLVKQWAADFYRLYPGAKVLAATKNDFKRENRRAFMAKIATGDWDAVIIAHSTFGFIKPAPEFEIEFNGAQIKDITDAINELGGDPRKSDSRDKATKRTVKQLAKMREKLQEKIKALRQKPMDNLLDLAELGVDALFVDEAHKFKNLMFTTKMQGVRVGGDPTGSQRAYDMYVKTQQIMKKSGGRGVVFATGTPISNTMAEMYHMLRYLAPQTLTDMGLKTFDAWADSFASAETFWMQSMSGSGYKASTRLEKFVNVPSLLKIYDQVADTVTMEDIKDAYREENPGKEFPIPPVKGGGARTAVSIKRSQAQTDYMVEVAKRAKALEQRKGPPKKGEDNMLSIMGDARKAAMDVRLVDPSITERDPEGRIAVCAENVWQRYQQYNAVKGTQLVFSDMGTPKKTAGKEMDEYKALKERADKIDDLDLQDRATLGDEEAITILEDAEEAATEIDKKGQDWLDAIQTALRGFSIYDDMKEALMEKGIPEHEIAFIHSYNTDDQKAALFKSVNSGIIRVLLGSTEKMGAGTNVQERAVAAHHLDVPWKPSDVEQREGRVVRQGNRLLDEVKDFEVEIMAYATQDTLDLYMWQTQENKLKMIGQLRTGNVDIEMDNAFEAMEFSAGEMQAAATSNPYLLDEIRIKEKIKKLERQKRSHEGQLNDIINRTAQAKRETDYLPAEIKTASDIASGTKDYEDKISAADAALKMTVQGVEVTGRENIRKTLNDTLDAMRSNITVSIAGTEYPVKNVEQFNSALASANGKAGEKVKTVSFDGSDFTLSTWGTLSTSGQAALESALDKTTAEQVKKSGFELGGKTYKSYSALAEGFRVLTGDREAIKFSTGGQDIIQRSKLKEAVSEALSKAVDGESRELLGQFGEVKVYVEAIPFKKDKTKIVLNAQVEHNGSVMDRDVLPPNAWDAEVDPSVAKLMGAQVVEKALQIMRSASRDAEHANERLTKAKRTLSDVEANTTDAAWPGEADLKEARAKYDTVLKQLSGRVDKNAPRNPVDDRAAKAERMAPIDSLLGNVSIDGKISPSDKAVYGMAAEVKSAAEILEFIASASRTPFNRQLARLLIKTGIAPSITVGTAQGWKFNAGNDKKYAAAYDPKSDTAALFRPAAAERNVLHELMHAATLKAMGKKGLAAVQMRALYNHVKASGKLKGMYGMANVDEFVAEAFTNPKFQQALKKVNAPVRSTGLAGAWDWFVRVVRGILGLKQGDHSALSAALEIGVGVMREDMAARKSGEATASQNNQMHYNLTEQASNKLYDLFHTDNKFNWLHKSVSTQFHKATIDKDFKKVFDLGQKFLLDNSRFAMDAADMAPSLLQKLGSLSDVFKKSASRADVEAISSPVFTGTLNNTVYSDAQLRGEFKLSDPQIALYREFREGVNKSLDDLGVSEMARIAKAVLPESVIESAKTSDFDAATALLHGEILNQVRDAMRQADQARAAGDETKAKALEAQGLLAEKTADDISKKAGRIRQLKEQGYAPLMRFGNYAVDVTKPNASGEDDRIYFGMYETQREANTAAREFKLEYPDAEVKQGPMDTESWKLFGGVDPSSLEVFAEAVGADESAIFQDYLRLTLNNRSALKRMIKREGIAGFSKDIPRVLSQFVTSNARLASKNYHFGDMKKAVLDIPKMKGDVKNEAAKLADYLQNPNEEAAPLRGYLFIHFLGGSIASALTNMTQPITMTFPYLSQFGGAGKAGAALATAGKLYVSGKYDAELEKAMKLAEREGITSPHEIHQLYAESERGLGRNLWVRKGLRVWGSMFALAEAYNRHLTFIAAFNMARENGNADPFNFAQVAVEATQGVYNKGNRPDWARGSIGATVFTFKQFSISYVEFLARLYKDDKKAFALAMAVMFMGAGAEGWPFAEDLEDLIDTVGQLFGHATNSKQWLRTTARDVFGEMGGDFFRKGISSVPGMPIDLSSRIGVSNLIPGTAMFKVSEKDKTKDIFEFIGPIGGFAQSAVKGFDAVRNGDVAGAVRLGAPIALQNIAKGAEMLHYGAYRDQGGRKVIDTTPGEAFAKAVGFQPNSVAKESSKIREMQQTIQQQRIIKDEIADKWAAGVFDKDPEKVKAAQADLRAWNLKNPEARISIAPEQISTRLKSMHSTREQRFIKTAPKEMRGQVLKELRG